MAIACDTARGLLYLHTAIPKKPLVHRDVKRLLVTLLSCVLLLFIYPFSANVLLDVSFRAKLGDFGLARPLDKEQGTTKRIVGTSGYIPPEYYRGYVTVKMDSFGFGVVSCVYANGRTTRT